MLIASKFEGYRAGRRTYHFDLGGEAPPAPDYTPVADASKESAEIAAALGRDQLAEARRQYNETTAMSKPVIETQLGIMKQTADQGQDYYDYSKTFRPIEQKMAVQSVGGLTARDMARLGTSPTMAANTIQKSRALGTNVGNALTMNNAWDGYWNQIPAGKAVDLAGGKLLRNEDGSATFTNAGGGTVQYDRGATFGDVAKASPEIATDWQKNFGYKTAGAMGGVQVQPPPQSAQPPANQPPPTAQAQPGAAQTGTAPVDQQALQRMLQERGGMRQPPLMRFASRGARAYPPGQRFAAPGSVQSMG